MKLVVVVCCRCEKTGWREVLYVRVLLYYSYFYYRSSSRVRSASRNQRFLGSTLAWLGGRRVIFDSLGGISVICPQFKLLGVVTLYTEDKQELEFAMVEGNSYEYTIHRPPGQLSIH